MQFTMIAKRHLISGNIQAALSPSLLLSMISALNTNVRRILTISLQALKQNTNSPKLEQRLILQHQIELGLQKRTLDISMPGYVVKQLQKYKHATPLRPQHGPFYPQLKQYGSSAQHPIPSNTSSPLTKDKIKRCNVSLAASSSTLSS
jgi:hypothetical protein